MKDKLVKNHKKYKFYRMKKHAISVGIVLGFAILITAPLSISIAAIQANGVGKPSDSQSNSTDRNDSNNNNLSSVIV